MENVMLIMLFISDILAGLSFAIDNVKASKYLTVTALLLTNMIIYLLACNVTIRVV